MNAHQFFDVFPMVVSMVGSARSPIGIPLELGAQMLQKNVENRHGATVAAEAVQYLHALFEGAKTGGLR